MREILFRGRDKYTNEWFYGFVEAPHTTVDGVVESYYFNSYVNGKSCRKIISANTLGQYTGLTDKNGTKIFEGDIVITKTTSYKFVGCILYSTEYVRFVCVTKSKMPYPMDSTFEYEVIGNIHDNPELLEA